MFCRNCGKEVAEQAVACMSCGLAPTNGNKFCWNCAAETNAAAIVCVKCGVPTTKPGRAATAPRPAKPGAVQVVGEEQLVYPSDPPKDPVMMCVLSVLLVGLGQILLGQTAKGITLLFGALLGGCVLGLVTLGLGFFLVPIIWLASAIDAYKIANKLKEGTPVGKWEFF